MRKGLWAVGLGLMILVGCQPQARGPKPVTETRIITAERNPQADAGNWLSHGRGYSEQRFSPLAQVTPANAGTLGLAWQETLDTNRGASATPLVVDGVMYTTSAWSVVYALDAKTGDRLWTFDPEVPRSWGQYACCDVVNRGVAVMGDKLYVGTIDGRLIALNRADGAKLWDVDTINKQAPYTITGAPRAAKGLVFIGNGGAEYGVRGYVSAYDGTTGELKWRFYTTPNPTGPDGGAAANASDPLRERMLATWNPTAGAWLQSGGGGTVWDSIAFDADTGALWIGVGNGSPWNRDTRSPDVAGRNNDNWLTASIVKLDAATGAYQCHYQTTPGDTWDFTATQHIMLADLTIDGRARKVAMQAPKNGFFYVLDRSDCGLISATPIVPMARADANAPPLSPISWSTGEIDAQGRPVENAQARYQAGTALVSPSSYGAHNWHPMAYSPDTGLVYIPIQEILMDWTRDPAFVYRQGRWNTGTVHAPLPPAGPGRDAVRNSLTGSLIAWDPVARREVARVRLAGPWNGGVLTTAGGLVVQGTVDGRLVAYNARPENGTLTKVWETNNQAATLAGPISYQVDGEQYIASMAGYGSVFFLAAGFAAPTQGNDLQSRVMVYKLGGTAQPDVPQLTRLTTPEPPVIRANAATLAQGSAVYGQFCAVCHGVGVVSGGVLPDLRRSMVLRDQALWGQIVHGGARNEQGMPGFGAWMSPAQAEQVRAYVASEARTLYQSEQAPR